MLLSLKHRDTETTAAINGQDQNLKEEAQHTKLSTIGTTKKSHRFSSPGKSETAEQIMITPYMAACDYCSILFVDMHELYRHLANLSS